MLPMLRGASALRRERPVTVDEIVQRRTRVIIGAIIDETGDEGRLGHTGKIVGVDVGFMGSPSDPYWEVEFPQHHRLGGQRRDMFWSQERTLVSADVEAHQAANNK